MDGATPGEILRDRIGDERDRTVSAVLGPTNTGKTHYAIERMLAHRTGVIGFPLRLLAREIYDRIVAMRGPRAVALITGEEKIAPATAAYAICTVEAMPLDWNPDFLAVDEIQLCADMERGHVFTDRLLRARGLKETLFLGSDAIRPRIASLIPRARFMRRERLSTLTYAGSKKIGRLPPRSAVVGFSVDSVYAIAELIRRQKGGAAVVMGALSPRTRNAQVALYQNGDVDHLVATDAIGMGLNLDVGHVAFAGLAKFDGRRHRPLEAHEIAQIAGRAGRFTTDGTFGVTGESGQLDQEMVDRVEGHRFAPIKKLQWRNHRLEFGRVEALLASLEAASPAEDLARCRESDDLRALRHLWLDPDIQDMTQEAPAVRLLWDVCQIPDFRKSVSGDHVALLSRIYRFLRARNGVIPSDWIEGQVRRLDRMEGDIETLSRRLAFVRTWTYVSHRQSWLADPAGWRDRARDIEDRLSDALHQRLTQRFVDRRTSVLMRRLKQKESLVAEVDDKGAVTVEGQFVGRLEGFLFQTDASAGSDEARTLKTAGLQALAAQFSHRADKFYNAPDTEIDMTEQGGLMWGDAAVGRLEKGADPLSPGVRPFVDETVEPAVREKVERRLGHWINRKIAALFEPLIAMRDDPALTGLARGVAFRIVENLGVIPRREISADLKSLEQEQRGMLRKHGVRFGQHNVFMPALLKPAPTRFRVVLWSLFEGHEVFPEAPPPGLVTIPKVEGAPQGFYERAGYRLAGARAIRIDMLERLADQLRALDQRAGFEPTADMLSITGCTLEQFADMMSGLGFVFEKTERPKASRKAPPKAVEQTPAPDAAASGSETVAAAEGPDAGAPAEDAAPETAAAPEPDPAAPAETPATLGEAVAAALAPDAAPETAVPEAAVPETAVPDAPAPEAPAPAPEAQAPAPGAEPVSPPATEVAAEDRATAEAEAAAPDAAEEAKPDAPVEMETVYTFRLAPRSGGGAARERGPRRGKQGGGADASARPEGERGPRGKPGGKPGGKSKREPRKGDKPRGDRKPRESAEPRKWVAKPDHVAEKRAVDPDNPFAALAALKSKT